MNNSADNQKRLGWDIALFIAAALVYRAFFWIALPPVLDSSDAPGYLDVAQRFAAGDFFSVDPNVPPLYPALGALVRRGVSDLELSCRIVSFAASVLLVVPVYLLSRALHGRASARVAAFSVAVWPWLADYGLRIAPESLYVFIWFLSVWLLAQSMRRGGWWLVLAPGSFFALHLARSEGTVLLLAAPVGAAILCVRGDVRNLRRLFPYILLCAALLAGYALFMHKVSGRATISPRVISVPLALRYALVTRGFETVRTFHVLFGEKLPIMLGPILALFAGAALFDRSQGARDLRLELYALYFAAVQFMCAVAGTYPHPRYIMPVIVLFSLWAARGVMIVRDHALAVPKWKWAAPLPVAAVALFFLWSTATAVGPEYVGKTSSVPREYKIAGLWMKKNLEPGLVMVRKPEIGLFAGMPTVGPRENANIPETLALAKECHARYLVIDERHTVGMIPGLAALLDPKQAPPGLKLLEANLSPYPKARIVIYEVLPDKTSPLPSNAGPN